MARLSGLASEHHPVGPGDAPRRKKGRKNTPSVDLSQASKRAASPSVEPSQPKRKRVQLNDHEQLARELDDSVSRSQSHAADTVHVVPENSNTTHRSRRHSEPPVSAHDEEDDSQVTPPPAPSTQPLAGLTPHLARVGAPRGRPSNARRARMSMPAQIRIEPIDENIGDQEFQYAPLSAVLDGRTRRRLRRSHLSEEVNEFEEHQKEDKKLRKEYAELRRELREKDKTIKDLEYQLEARRLGNIDMTDDHAEELQDLLTQARNEIAELRASSIYTGDSREQSTSEGNVGAVDDNDDDDGLMLIDPEELDHQEEMATELLPNGEYASRALAMSSQVTVQSLATLSQTSYDVLADASHSAPASIPDKISDQAVKRYEIELEHLTQQLADSQGALRVIAIELQNLHVVELGASSDVIITKLRHGFEAVREELENLLPNRTIGLTNSELLHKIPEFFEGILAELREKVVLSEKHYQNERVLRSQYESVLDLLSRSEEHNDELEKRVNDLEVSNAERQQSITNFQDRIATLDSLVESQDAEIQQKTAEISSLNDEIEEKEIALSRLHDSIETYRKDLDTVTRTTTRLEDEHRQTIAEMEQDHATMVLDLQAQLDEESEARQLAEGDAQQKTEYIDELEEKIELIESSVGTITEEVETLRGRLAAEIQNREHIEKNRDEQAEIAYTHANTIENLNETIEDLEAQIVDFKNNLEAERTQREETESALDQANAEITDLNTRLHDLGIQANELRSKLFQVQQEKAQAIADMEEKAMEREAEHEDQLNAETQHSQETEQEVDHLKAEAAELENTIATLEDDIKQMTAARDELEQDRDERVAILNTQLADLKKKYAALENSSNSTITTLQANITDLTNQVNAQRAEIDRITEDATALEHDLREELRVKTDQITVLENDLDISRATNDRLVRENKSLEERVADEAMELLRIDDAHAQERESLREVIRNNDAVIKNLQNVAAMRATEHAEAIAEKTSEIEELRIMGDARAEYIVSLEMQIEDIKERFRVAEEDNRTVIDTLTESQRQLQQQNENLAAALKKRNAEALKAIQEMKVKGVEVKTKGVELHKVANGKISKVSERVKIGKKGGKKKVQRRQWDSGFGVDEDIENGDIDEVGVEEGVVG